LIKCVEWYSKLKVGLTISTNAFFMHYYMMTGVHLFHMLLGLVIPGDRSGARCTRNAPRAHVLESGASYWHAIDLLWVVIFALLYLVR
jgi:nitric oxide reductase NorE protein